MTVTIASNVESVNSVMIDDPLVISGGGLAVAADSTISGGLTMTGGTMTASGSGVTFTVTGTTAVSGANLYAEGGATFSLAAMTSYTGSTSNTQIVEATGTGSKLNFPELASIIGGGNDCCSYAQFEALAGGALELPALTQISGGAIWLESDGTGSVLDAPDLASMQGVGEGGQSHGFQASNGGSLDLPLLATCTDETIVAQGAALSLPDVSDIDGSGIMVSSGSQLSLPAVTSYNGSTSDTQTIEATGTGSVLNLPELASIIGGGNDCCSYAQFEALAGGDVELPALTQISGGAIWLESDGTGSTLDAPLLSSFQGVGEGGQSHGFQVSNGGSFLLPELATFTDETIVDQGASLSLPDLSDIDGSSVVDSAGSLSVPNLTDIDGSTLQISGDVAMTLPAVTSADAATLEISGGASPDISYPIRDAPTHKP